MSTAKPTISMNPHRSRLKSSSSGSDTPNASNTKYHTVRRCFEDKFSKRHKSYVQKPKGDSNKFKVKLKSTFKSPKLSENKKLNKKECSLTSIKDNIEEKTRKEITTGKGLAVPISEGEEIVCIFVIMEYKTDIFFNLR